MIVAQKTFRTGVQTLTVENTLPLPQEPCCPDCTLCSELRLCLWDAHWFVSIKNKTYRSKHPLPAYKAEIWKDLLT